VCLNYYIRYLWRLPPEKPLVHHHELSMDPSSSQEGHTVFPDGNDDASDGISGLRRPHFHVPASSTNTTTTNDMASPLGGLNSPNSMGFTASLDSSSSPGMPGSVQLQQPSHLQSQSLQLPPPQTSQSQSQPSHQSSPPGAMPRPSTGGHDRSPTTGGTRGGAAVASNASLDRSHRSGQGPSGSSGSIVSMSTTASSQKLAKKFANPRDAPEEVRMCAMCAIVVLTLQESCDIVVLKTVLRIIGMSF